MKPKAPNLLLTESQAACLVALRHHKKFKTEIAMQAELDLHKTAKALEKLEELGLARRGETDGWHPTGRGRKCRFKTVRIEFGAAVPSLVPAPGACWKRWIGRCGAESSRQD